MAFFERTVDYDQSTETFLKELRKQRERARNPSRRTAWIVGLILGGTAAYIGLALLISELASHVE